MGIRIDGNNDLIKAVDDTLTIEGISVNTSGMVTATGGIKVGTAATIHSTGQFNIGVAHTLFANGNATHSGIVTASSFVGSGANLTGITQTTITDNANNRVITGSDTSNTLIAETGLTYNTQTLLLNNTSANPQFHLTSAANGLCEVKFGDANDATRGNIIYRNGTSGEALCFHGYNNTERMRITSDGGIGIGTTNPYVLNEPAKFNELTIGGKTEGAAITLRDDNGNVKGGLFTSDVTGAMIVRTITNHDMHFRTNNTDRLILNNDGHLAVGAEPSSGLGLFSVKPISGTDAFFKIRGASDFDGNLSGSVIDNRNSANSASKDFIVRSQNLVLWQDSSEKIRIPSGGGVGINTTKIQNASSINIAGVTRDFTNSSTDLCDAGGLFLQPTITLPSTGQAYPGIFWTGNTASLGRARAGIQGVAASNNDATDIVFLAKLNAGGAAMTPADERMRIRNNGHVGIASDVPTVELDVNGHVHLGSKKFIFRSDTGHFGIYDSVTDLTPNNEIEIHAAAPQIRLEENSSGASKRLDLLVTASGQPTIAANQSSQSIAFETTGSERFRITNDGVTFNGDTAAANALGDYEEGTYTAHFNVEGQSNMSMSGRIGLYTKVGQVVTVMGGGTVASTGGESSSHAIQFTNLPFPVHTTSGTFGHTFTVLMRNLNSTGMGNMSGNQPYQFQGRLFVDNDSGRIEGIQAGGAQDPVNASLAITTNSEMGYMFTYLTDA